MPEIGKGRITPGTGKVSYTKKVTEVSGANLAVGDEGTESLVDLRSRLVAAEYKVSTLTQDVQDFAVALNSFESLISDNDTSSSAISVQDVLSSYGVLTQQVEALNDNLTLVTNRVIELEENPVEAGEADLTEVNAALVTLDARLDVLEPLVANATDQITDLVVELANAVAAIETKASQAGLDAVAASVVTKANKSTKINTGGLASGGGDLSADRNIIVPKATAAEVDAGVIDHKAVTPASLINVLASIREIEEPIGIGTTNILNTRLWLPGTTGSQGKFTELVTSSTAQNAVALGVGPLATIEPIWTATTLPGAVTATNDINGGFEYCIDHCDEDFNPKHSYRFAIFVKQDDANGVLHFSCENNVVHLNGQAVGTPSFLSSFNLPQANKWYLLVGVVHGHTFTGTDDSSGIYDPATGLRVVNGVSFKSKAGVGTQKVRIYRQNATVNGSKLALSRPRIDIITGEEPSLRSLFGTANDIDKANKTITVTGAGLASGGGDLTQNRVITVEKATSAQILAGTNDTAAITPKGLKDNVVHVMPKATEADLGVLTSETVVVTPKSLRGLRKATPEEVQAKSSNDVFVTPASLAGVDFGSGGSGGSAPEIASAADVTAGTNNTKMVTPAALSGLKKATISEVAARTSNTVFVTPASLNGLTIPDGMKATTADVQAMTNPNLLVTPASLAGLPKDFATEAEMLAGTSEDTIVSPMLFRSMAAGAEDVDLGTSADLYVTPAALAASDIATAVTNFNSSNDRNGAAIPAPTIASNGTAVDHVINTDSSATISFEWSWTGDESTIDGFVVLFHVQDTDTLYPFDGSQTEYSLLIPADKRAIIQPGVAADKFYSFAVKAYRMVDSDIDPDGFIYSTVAKCSDVNETPYQPSAEVAFGGNIIGTIDGLNVTDVSEAVSNFNDRNDRDGTPIAPPVLSTTGQCVDHVNNTDGSVDISFEWAWPDASNDASQAEEASIDGFIVYYRIHATDDTEYTFTNPSDEFVLYVESNKRAIVLPGVAGDKYYSFGVRAYRVVDTDIDPTGVIKTAIITPTRAGEKPYKPEDSIAFFGNIAGTINNVSAADITDGIANFNSRNDRLSTTVAAPVIASNGTAVDHVLNNDSSCDISFEWSWTGDESTIDGFYVIYHVSPASGITPPYHAFNSPATEVVVPVPADRRAIFLTGVGADKYYSFAVLAYRIVDSDINSSGVIKSTLTKCTHASEMPYRPTENLAFVGELTGTIDGESQAYVADAARNFNLRNDRNGTAVVAPTITNDGTAIDHVINTDGSASISFEWNYSGSEADIDGFILYRHVADTNASHNFTTPTSELVMYLPSNKRSIILPGVPADKWYSFGIRSYRIVDNDVSTAAGSPVPGIIQSAIIMPTNDFDEHPYRPTDNVAFSGRITGTIGNTAVSTVESAVTNFDQRNDRMSAPVVAPVIAADGTAVDHVINTDGSATISFEWGWSGTESHIDGFIFYHHISSSNTEHTFNTPTSEMAVFVPASKRAVIMTGVPADRYHSFGIRAYRVVDPDIAASGYIQSAIITPQGAGEKPYQPSANVAFAGDISGTINGVGVATITDSIQNFNDRNDRNGAAIAAPTLAADGTAIDHINNVDGSVSISLEWSWSGTEEDIDGFMVYINVSSSSVAYTNFTGGNNESTIYLPANRRAFHLTGVPATRYYNFGVRAYRVVDPDINNTGFIYSNIAVPIGSESPYRPRSTTVIGGDDNGDGGVLIGDVVASVQQAADAFDLATELNTSIGDFSDDGVITYLERLIIRRELTHASAERVELRENATNFGVTTELTAEETAWQAMMSVLTTMVPPYDSDTATSSPIDRDDYETKVNAWRTALQALANRVAIIASESAEWDNVTGDNRPEDNATANPQTIYPYFPTAFEKTGGVNGTWDAQVRSNVGYTTDFTLRFKVDPDHQSRELIVGLHSNPSAVDRSDFTGAFEFSGTNTVEAVSYVGSTKTVHGTKTFSYDSLFEIRRSGTTLDFYLDGVRFGNKTITGGLSLFVDSSFRHTGRRVYMLTVFGTGITSQPKYTATNCSLNMATEGQGNFDGKDQWTLINGQWTLTATGNYVAAGPFYPGEFKKPNLSGSNTYNASIHSVDESGAVRKFPVGSKLFFRLPVTSGAIGGVWNQFMIGFNSDPMTSTSATDIDAAIELTSANTITKYVDGTGSTTAAVIAREWLYFEIGTADVTLKRAVNDATVFTFTGKGGQELAVDSSFKGTNAAVDGVSVVLPNGYTTPVRYAVREASDGDLLVVQHGLGELTQWVYLNETRVLIGGKWELISTVGAPEGTLIGTVPVEDLLADTEQALEDASNALTQVTDIVADNILSRDEKPSLIREWTRVQAEKTALLATAAAIGSSAGLVAARDALEDAYDALAAYLTALTGWNDTAVNTTIVAATFSEKWTDYYETVGALVAQMDEAAAASAVWANVTGAGRPADNATANVYRGEWAGSTVYNDGDIVTYLGSSYIVTTDHTSDAGSPPPNANLGLIASGANTKLVTLSYNQQFIRFGSDNNPLPASQTLTFTANLQNTTATTATWTATRYNNSNVSLGSVTLGGSGNTRTLTETQFGNAAYCRITATATADGLSDTVTVIRTEDGDNVLAGYLTNEAITLAADSAGTVTSYATANGTFKVYHGASDVTTSCAFAVVSESACDVTINAATGAYTVSSMSAEMASATLEATYGGVTIQKVLTLAISKSGDAGVVGYLTNESHVVSASNAGVVSSFVGAGGTFKVIYGLTDVTGTNCLYSVQSETGVDVSINSTTGVYVINSMSDDVGYATLRCVYTGVTPNVTIDKTYSLTKSKAGPTGNDGATAKAVTLVADRMVVTFNQAGLPAPSAQTTTFTVGRQNTTGTVTWTLKDSKGNTLTPTSYLVIAGDTFSATLSASSFNAACAVNTADGVVVTATITDGVTLSDTVTLTKLRDGSNAVSGYLTNEAQSLASDNNGTVASFSSATGTFKVYFGTTDITTGASTAYAVTAQTGCTGTINATTGVYSVTAMSADQASLTMTATTTSSYGSIVLTRVFSLTKSKTGQAGFTAKTLTVTSDRQIMAYDSVGAIVPGQTVSLRANKQNTTSTIAWSLTTAAGAILNASSYLTSGAGTRTNHIAYSEKLGATASANWWTDTNVTITANATTAPDGTLTGDLLTPNTTSGAHRIYRNGLGSGAIGDVVTVSMFAKSNGYDFLAVIMPFVNSNAVIFNVSTGSVSTSGAGWTAAIYDVGNGWFRCTMRGTTTAATANTCQFLVTGTNSTANYAGNGTSGMYLWGAQLTVENEVGPYIKTDGTTITAVIGEAVTLSDTNYALAADAQGVIVTGSVTDGGTMLTDSISINKVQAGASAIAGFLTNESHTLAADASGVVSSFTGASGSFKVFLGTTDVTASSTFALAPSGNPSSLGYTLDSSGNYAITSMTPDAASITFRATYSGQTIDKVFSVSKSKIGAAGAAAKNVTISTDRQAVLFDGLGALNPGGTAQSIQFTANKRNTTNTVNWTVTKLDGSATDLVAASNYFSTTAAGGTGASSGNVVYMTPTQFAAARGTTNGVIVKAEVVDGVALSDTTTIIKLQAGSNAVSGYLSNESQTLAADNAGTVASFAAATGTFKVFYGSTDITTGQSTVFAKTSETGCTGTINASTGVYSVSAMSADTASVTFTATTSSTYGNVVLTKTFALAKSKTGAQGAAGANATLFSIAASRQSITYSNNAASPSAQTTTFTSFQPASSATVNWSIATLAAPGTPLTPVTNYLSAATGTSVTMTAAQFNTATGGAAGAGVVITGTVVVNGVTISDNTSVVRIDSGATSVVGYLTNESHVVAADSLGAGYTLPAGGTGTFKVFFGTTDVTTSATFSSIASSNATATIDASGNYTLTALSADTASVTFRAAYGGTNIDKVFSISKSRSGQAGSNGLPGTDGADGANAKTLIVISDRQTIGFSGNSPSPSSQTTTFTAQKQNTTATVGWAIADTLGNPLSVSYLSASSGNSVTLTAANFATAIATNGATGVVVTASVTDGVTISDKISLLRVVDGINGSTGPTGPTGPQGPTGPAGANAVIGFLTNESHTVATDSAGNNGVYTTAGGTFRVFNGITEVTTGNGITYSVVAATSGLSISINSSGVYSISGSTVDAGTATLRAAYNPGTGVINVDKVYSITKSKAGATGGTGPQGPQGPGGSAGADAKTLMVICDRQTISYDGAGALSPTSQTITFTALKQNTTATVNWSITDINGTAMASSYLSAASGNQVTMSAANFNTARNGTSGVIVTGTLTDGTTLTDKISVMKVQQGADGAQGPQGPTGPAGRDAMVYHQNSTVSPTGMVNGDTWYQPDTKKWFRYNGTSWVQLLGNIAQYDQITAANVAAGVIAADAIGANQINVNSLDALSATVGLLRTATSGARVEIENNQIRVYDASNVLRVRLGLW